MAGSEFEREVKDIVVKSGLTGVAATVLAVTMCSPAGLGGMIGTSLASGFGGDPNSASENPYANLPPYPAPLTNEEISDIRGQLASTSASMEITRAATNPRIERVRSLAMVDGLVSFSAMPRATPAPVVPQLAHATPTPAPVLPQVAAAEQPIEQAPVMRASLAADAPSVETTPVSYISVDGGDAFGQAEFTHLEFADLLLASDQL
ncbi:MAG: hypothetical protein K2P58_07840 [Hyphomonadaceae bacterium]|nr:hypothetical protein [Hyphomonadaceae bacterium]